MTTTTENGTQIIVTERDTEDGGFVVELVLPNGFETEQQGLYNTAEEAMEAGKVWAAEDWSEYL